jgi:penicillin-binding protein 2
MFGLLALRLANMQIIHGSSYAQRSHENHISANNILPPRGLLFDRNGKPLVENVGIYTATIVPELLPKSEEDRRRIYLWMEKALQVPALEVQQRVKDAERDDLKDKAIVVKSGLSKAQALVLDEASVDMPGVSLTIAAGRKYIEGDAYAHVLGFTGAQSAQEYAELRKKGYQLNERVGKAGVESRYETDLRGQPGISANEVDAEGHVIQALKTQDPVRGNSLKLALDDDLQQYVAQLLDDTMDNSKATVAAAVVMDVKTGEILALVSRPGYDDNLFSRENTDAEFRALLEDPRKPLINQALSPSAPGSTFKLVTASAALQNGNITPGTTRIVSSASLELKDENGDIFILHDWRAHGPIDLYGAIAWSSNIYFFMASCGILNETKGLAKNPVESAYTLAYYARAFGFGQATGIDLDASEADGIIPTPEWKARAHSGSQFNPEDREWYYSDTCFMGVGQGDVTATPLQIARMTAAVANGGKLLTPHVVKEVVGPDGKTVRAIKPEVKQVPVDAKNLAVIREGMHQSVLYGAGAAAKVPGVDIAGKTGTAEFGPIHKDGTFDQHAWFTGFAPFNDPEIVVTVYYDLGVGGTHAAPVAGKIFQYYMDRVKK